MVGFFRIVPPSGESQLNPSSIDDIAEEDFSLSDPELADRLDKLELGEDRDKTKTPFFPLLLLMLLLLLLLCRWIKSLASDICRAESKLLLSLESGVLTVSTRRGLNF